MVNGSGRMIKGYEEKKKYLWGVLEHHRYFGLPKISTY